MQTSVVRVNAINYFALQYGVPTANVTILTCFEVGTTKIAGPSHSMVIHVVKNNSTSIEHQIAVVDKTGKIILIY